jgi:2,3-bisphosphoglycerate-dependent phosphoglycerate mutase
MESNSKVYKLVLVRHGESSWNLENRFTGWTDVDLSETGVIEALSAGERLKDWKFDVVHTSVLKRAIKTWNLIAEKTDQHHLPVNKHWRLNERHYGALQGLNKSETAQKHGEEQVKIWRRAYDISPPALDKSDPRHPANESKYKSLPSDVLPYTEVTFKFFLKGIVFFWFFYKFFFKIL